MTLIYLVLLYLPSKFLIIIIDEISYLVELYLDSLVPGVTAMTALELKQNQLTN